MRSLSAASRSAGPLPQARRGHRPLQPSAKEAYLSPAASTPLRSTARSTRPARWLPLVSVVLLASLTLGSCDPPVGETEALRLEGGQDWFVVWQGFTHAWTHNHRWNRFGDWVEEIDYCLSGDRCFGLAHSAASGTSGDVADFRSDHVEVTAPGVGFGQVQDEVVVDDLFGEEHIWTRVGLARIQLEELPEWQAASLRDRDGYLAFLNGWDLFSEQGWPAAKPIDLALEVDPPHYREDEDLLEVEYRVFLRMGCSTEECSPDDSSFRYRVRPTIAVIAWDGEQVVPGQRLRIGHTFAWEAPPNSLGHGSTPGALELELDPITGSFETQLGEGVRFVAQQRLILHLFQEVEGLAFADQHMVEWRSRFGVEPSGRSASFEVELMFKNWTEGMSRYQTFAYKDIGAARMTTDLVLVELRAGARVTRGQWTGSHPWNGAGRSAAGDDAVTRSWEVDE